MQVLEKLEEQLLPSLYAAISASFSATAQQLGYPHLWDALWVQALCSPLGGVAGAILVCSMHACQYMMLNCVSATRACASCSGAGAVLSVGRHGR